MKEKRFRKKIGWFQFVCCLLVIWNHSGNLEMPGDITGAAGLPWRIEFEIVPAVIRINIPCFFMLSAYLFYRGFDLRQLKPKWKRRVKSLLIPYLLWNFLYYLGYLLGSWIPGLSKIVNRYHMELTARDFLESVLYYKSNPSFWFMFQLLLLTLLAPVLYLVLEKVWSGVLWLAMLLTAIFTGEALPFLNLDALFYYSVAAFAALHGQEAAEAVWSRRRCRTGVIFIAVGAVCSFLYYRNAAAIEIVAGQSLISMGLWLAVDGRRLPRRRRWMGCTFFIYAFHIVPVRLINKLAMAWIPERTALLLMIYAVMPALAVFACWQTARRMKRWVPGLWAVLTGGR